jgi:hypothetical protein
LGGADAGLAASVVDCRVAHQWSQDIKSIVEFFQKALGPGLATKTMLTSCPKTVTEPLFETVSMLLY